MFTSYMTAFRLHSGAENSVEAGANVAGRQAETASIEANA
jgi:hypothetical protein